MKKVTKQELKKLLEFLTLEYQREEIAYEKQISELKSEFSSAQQVMYDQAQEISKLRLGFQNYEGTLQGSLDDCRRDLVAARKELYETDNAKKNWKHIVTYNGGEVKAALELLAKALGLNL